MNPSCCAAWAFTDDQMVILDDAVALAEEVTSNHFKFSASQWRRSRYDIRTLQDLQGPEITDVAFAQILRYIAKPPGSDLGSTQFDFYKVCLQDHVVLQALDRDPSVNFFTLMTYVVTHELVHIVRFSRFLQSFEAYPSNRTQEEARVHSVTEKILRGVHFPGLDHIMLSYRGLLEPVGVSLDQFREGV